MQQIVAAEGSQAEPEALEILARRAAGSMRDSQSLLEQLLAFGGRQITVADVHRLLGTAGDRARWPNWSDHLVDRDAAAALAELDRAVTEGVDVGQLLEQLLGYFRDVHGRCRRLPGRALLAHVAGRAAAVFEAAAKRLGLETSSGRPADPRSDACRGCDTARKPHTGRDGAGADLRIWKNSNRLSQLITQLRDGTPINIG